MIASLNGRLSVRAEGQIVVEVGGVGLVVSVSNGTLAKLGAVGNNVSLHTHLIVREDNLQLYGFASEDERALFLLLLGVQSVGPKVALSVLSAGTPSELASAAVLGDVATFQRVPGIGKRTAERIIVELKDKLADYSFGSSAGLSATDGVDSDATEAVAALLALGFSHQESLNMLDGLVANSTGELVALALKGRGSA